MVKEAPVLVRALTLWLVVEAAAALLLPLIASERWYVDAYLPDAAETSLREFLSGDAMLIPDPVTGWRSAPSKAIDGWVTDRAGGRNSGRLHDQASVHVLALGSSMVNGGTGVTGRETVTGFLENDTIAVDNHGTMLWGVDQSLLAYESRFKGADWDVIIVGVDADALLSIGNVYVPLRQRSQTYLPFTKPRFIRDGEALRVISGSPDVLLSGDADTLITHVRQYDTHASTFARFRRLSQTPGLAAVAWLIRKVEEVAEGYRADEAMGDLLIMIMHRFQRDAEESGSRLIFVAMPPPLGDRRFPGQPDQYGARLDAWRREGFAVVDGRAALAEQAGPVSGLYAPDGLHLTPAGNRILAERIRNAIEIEE